MCKRYYKLTALLLIAFLPIGKSYCQSCLICLGGSSDGNAKDFISSCNNPTTIFVGGIYTTSTSNATGACSSPSLVFVAGGFYSGFSHAADGACAAPSSFVAGGAFDGSSNVVISPCNSPTTILTGGEYDGFSIASISPCAVPSTLLAGGSYDGFSNTVVSVCEPPASLVIGGEHAGMADAFLYCEPLGIATTDNLESLIVNLFPNPASGDFVISFDAPLQKGIIIINDALGKEIVSQLIYPSKQQYLFEAKDLAQGAYAIRIIADGKQINKQFMIIK